MTQFLEWVIENKSLLELAGVYIAAFASLFAALAALHIANVARRREFELIQFFGGVDDLLHLEGGASLKIRNPGQNPIWVEKIVLWMPLRLTYIVFRASDWHGPDEVPFLVEPGKIEVLEFKTGKNTEFPFIAHDVAKMHDKLWLWLIYPMMLTAFWQVRLASGEKKSKRVSGSFAALCEYALRNRLTGGNSSKNENDHPNHKQK